jgi:hypothetical protein
MFSVRRTAKNPRVLMLLVAFSFFLLLLAMSNTKPVYAAGTVPAPQRIIPGGDDGGPTPAPNTIYGQLESLGALGPYPAHVLVNLIQFTSIWTIYTDDIGCFQFQTGAYYPGQTSLVIMPNIRYEITVNGGYINEMGGWIPDPAWGQWAGYVVTDDTCWAQVYPRLQPAAVVNVTYAALFSNTQFATLQYGLQTTSTFSHSVSFNVLNSGISIGYSTSSSATFTCWVTGASSISVAKHHYANAFYDSTLTNPAVVKAGISSQVPFTLFYSYPAMEYVNPSTLNVSYADFSINEGSGQKYQYSETGSHTWGATAGVPFGIIFSAWSQVITLGETVTTSGTNDVSFTVYVPSGYGYGFVNFRAYSPGAGSFNPLQDPNKGTGGLELHVWDMSGKG